jgi:MEMO1 family protein
MIRKPAVAYQFYPGESAALKKTVESLVRKESLKEDAIAMIAPHAGYIYSGKVAGSVYSRVNIPDNILLLGPNHTGLGERAALMSNGEWEMPFGKVTVNQEIAQILIEESHIFSDDSTAHAREHSLEVQLPFIQYFNPKASIVPVTIMYMGYEECKELGKAVANAIRRYNDKILIVVSSDMNHYERDSLTKKKDRKAIDKILALNSRGLMEIVSSEDISMCGIIPATVALAAAKELGAKKAELIDYATSGDTSGDYEHVVGYAGILIH